jgi:hypothetical protein
MLHYTIKRISNGTRNLFHFFPVTLEMLHWESIWKFLYFVSNGRTLRDAASKRGEVE